MTQEQEQHVYPYYRSASSIRNEAFSHRMRGFDEAEVREYLDMLADQVQAADAERAELRADNERLRIELDRIQSGESKPDADDLSPQAVALFSQAQLVADQLVEEAVRHARELMTSARQQQREILQKAHEAAAQSAREADIRSASLAEERAREVSLRGAEVRDAGVTDAGIGWRAQAGANSVPADRGGSGYVAPIAEVEYVKTFARVAQVQLRSVLDALTEQVDKLAELPPPVHDPGPPPVTEFARQVPNQEDFPMAASWRSWQIDIEHADHPEGGP